MKKRNLNWLLALLAALALVFAGACAQDGADGADGKDGATTDYSGKTYTYDGAEYESSSSHTTTTDTFYWLNSVDIAFAESGTGATVTATYDYCTGVDTVGCSTSTGSAKVEIAAYYVVLGDGNVELTLPSYGVDNVSNSASTLYLAYDSDNDQFSLSGASGTTYYLLTSSALNLFAADSGSYSSHATGQAGTWGSSNWDVTFE